MNLLISCVLAKLRFIPNENLFLILFYLIDVLSSKILSHSTRSCKLSSVKRCLIDPILIYVFYNYKCNILKVTNSYVRMYMEHNNVKTIVQPVTNLPLVIQHKSSLTKN